MVFNWGCALKISKRGLRALGSRIPPVSDSTCVCLVCFVLFCWFDLVFDFWCCCCCLSLVCFVYLFVCLFYFVLFRCVGFYRVFICWWGVLMYICFICMSVCLFCFVCFVLFVCCCCFYFFRFV